MKDIKFDIIGLGACGMDLRAEVHDVKKINFKNKILAKSFDAAAGGVTANNLTQTAKLGLRSLWIGGLGNDEWARYLTEKFKNDGVFAMPIIKNSPTQQFWIIADDFGKLNMVGIPGASKVICANDINNLSCNIFRTRHFHSEVAVIPLNAVLAGAKIAKKNNAKIFIDIDDDPFRLINENKIGTLKELREIIRIADVLKFSKSGALGLSKEKTISKKAADKIISLGANIIFITMADKGCIAASKDFFYKFEGFKVKNVIDAVGAGDAFMGGVSYGFLQDWGIEKIAAFANACGAFKCLNKGARSSGKLAQIEELLKKYEKS